MDAIQAIMTRRSVRNYLDKEIPNDVLETILRAGMAGPSATNAREWAFIVTRDPEIMNKMADCNGGPAAPARKAKVCILVCGDLERAFPPAPDYWVIDGAIAAQNMILAAHALGVGSVWLGTWPQMERVDAQRRLFQLPEHIIPHSLIAFGYPDVEAEKQPRKHEPPKDLPAGVVLPPPPKETNKGAFEPDRVHYDKW